MIEDTLSVALPIASSKNKAQAKVTKTEVTKFCKSLSKTLEPHDLEISPISVEISSWIFISITRKSTLSELGYHKVITTIAENTGTTKVIIKSDQQLNIGLLNQYRYWTPSRARLLGLQLIKHHSDVLRFN